VLRPLLAGLAVQPNVDQMVGMMSRTLISRPNVDRVIRMADMDIQLQSTNAREQMITRLTKELTIQSAGAENLYTIAYTDQNPQQAKRVVQSLLTIFVEGSLGNKRKDMGSAQRFINEQLKVYGDRLRAAENAMAEFRHTHLGQMGGAQQNYYTRLGETQASLNQAQLDLKEAENSRDAIKKQLDGEDLPVLIGEQGTAEAADPEIDGRIQSLNQQLDALRLKYTEQHPDIVAILRSIDRLKEQKQQKAKLRKPGSARPQSQNVVSQQLSVSLAEAEANVASMKARVAEYEKRYSALKAAADTIPKVDAEYTQLTRDYEVTRSNYNSLLSRLESAQISGNMEASTSVMDFRVIDPPEVPSVPSAPNRPLLISMVLLAALGGGIGFAFLLSQVRPTLFDERRLREVSGLPVFGTVVWASTEARRAKQKKGLIAILVSFLALLSAYAAILATFTLTAARV
jgi:protein tyrosine kinase modulator